MTENTENEVNKQAKLAQKIAQAQKNIREVEKKARNEFHKYNYASADAIIQEARKALQDTGVVVIQNNWHYKEQGGDVEKMYVLEVKFAVIDTETGYTEDFYVPVPFAPTPGRQGLDKAMFAALTESIAYFLRGLLLIPRIGEGEIPIPVRDDRNISPCDRFREWMIKTYPSKSREDLQLLFREGLAKLAEKHGKKYRRLEDVPSALISELQKIITAIEKPALIKLINGEEVEDENKTAREQT